MKKFSFFLCIILSALALAGCAVPSPTATSTTGTAAAPAPVVNALTAGQKICAVLQPAAENISFSLSQLVTPLDATDATNISKATASAEAFCTDVATITQETTQALLNQILPTVLSIIESSSMSANGKDLAIVALGGIQTIAQIVYPTLVPVLAQPTVTAAPSVTTAPEPATAPAQ